MILYQIVDEKNNIVDEYQKHDKALRSLEDITMLFQDHYYHIETLVLEDTKHYL